MNLVHRMLKALIGLVLVLCTLESAAATIKLKIIDQETGEPVPARVLITNLAGQSYFPDSTVTLQIGQETWFMSPGISKLKCDSEILLLRVERGKEYERVKKEIRLSGKNEEEVVIVLKRWINMRELGYLSGENHLHRSAKDIAAMCAAEDLSVGTSLQWWFYPRFDVPEGNENLRYFKFGEMTIPVSVYDAEIEESWGALYIINLPNPFPFTWDKGMPNLIGAKYGRKEGALNCYQGGWSREVLVDALLGYVDVVNVCNNNFLMHRWQPRSRYSNLLNVEELPVYPNTPEGMMQMNTDTYYRLLNCGLKLAAGAGSATGVKATPAGFNRAYVRVNSEDGINGFYKNWKVGKNFVTNGPMLFLSTSEGLQPGDSLNFTGTKTISLSVEAISDSPLQKVEIVVNGKVVKSFPIHNKKKFTGNFEITLDQSSWVCARCTDNDMLLDDKELETYRVPTGQSSQDPNRLRFAHTSPIYFHKDGKGIYVQKSVKEGLEMIEAFKHFAMDHAADEYRELIIQAADKAEEILKNR